MSTPISARTFCEIAFRLGHRDANVNPGGVRPRAGRHASSQHAGMDVWLARDPSSKRGPSGPSQAPRGRHVLKLMTSADRSVGWREAGNRGAIPRTVGENPC